MASSSNLTIQEIEQFLAPLVHDHPANRIDREIALDESCENLVIFDEPLIGVASADDPLFDTLKESSAVGPDHLSPKEWTPDAVSVISLFFPFTEQLRKANRVDSPEPIHAWLHGRIQGQEFIAFALRQLIDHFESMGFQAMAPLFEERFATRTHQETQTNSLPYSSSWSERHVAYISGLGTFGLSRGLITKKGMAGRFGSLITTAILSPTPREYSGVYDYCAFDGACIPRCPVDAIALDKGKDNRPCLEYQDAVKAEFPGYYGCGKCQVAVPCESGIPNR